MGQLQKMNESITTPKRAIICARVSTTAQAEKGHSIPSQFELMRVYAHREGMTVIAELQDEISGTIPIRQRPGGAKLYEHIDNRTADAVVFFTVDRVTRDEDLIEINVIRRDIRGAGMELHYANDGGKTDLSTMGGMIDTFKAAFAAEERKKIRERTMRGMRRKATEGRMVGQGGPRYGYRFEGEKPNRQYVVDDAQADVIRLIFRWFLQGDGISPLSKPMTLWTIAVKLTAMGVPTPSTRNNRPRKVMGQWSRTSIFEIIRDETYTGVARFGKVVMLGKKKVDRPLAEQVAITVPAIIDRETWEKAQGLLKQNKANATRNAHRVYLLRGLIFCGKCGSRFGGNSIKGTHRYLCNQFAKVLNRPELKCKQPSVLGPWLDAEAWAYVLDIITDEDKFKQALQLAQKDDDTDKKPAIDELALVNRLIAEKEIESTNLSEQAKRVKPGGLSAQTLQAQMEQVEAAYDELAKQRDELRTKIDQKPITDSDVDRALEARRALFEADAKVGMANPTPEAQRALFELFNLKVTVTDQQVDLTCRLPVESRTVDFRRRLYSGRIAWPHPLSKSAPACQAATHRTRCGRHPRP